MKATTLLMLIILLVISVACESQSGRRANSALQPLTEKIVIIDALPSSYTDYSIKYKVKRISKGVVTFISFTKSEGVFEKGDTIYYKFN